MEKVKSYNICIYPSVNSERNLRLNQLTLR